MDSKSVNREIRGVVRPVLTDAGFRSHTARTSWRHTPSRIDVINFQSFNAYHAGRLGVTTHSFAINLGCFFRDVPDELGQEGRGGIKVRDGQPCPEEYHCHFRRRLRKSSRLPKPGLKEVWYIAAKGKYLDESVRDACRAIQRVAFPWFERFADQEEVLRTLLEDEQDMKGTWGFGNSPSPHRSYLTGFIALSCGEYDLAVSELSAAGESGCYQGVADELGKAIRKAKRLGKSAAR